MPEEQDRYAVTPATVEKPEAVTLRGERDPVGHGAAKARDFADKVLIGHAERKFRGELLALLDLQCKAAAQAAALTATVTELGIRLDAFAGDKGD